MFESPSKLLNTLNFWGTAFATSPALYWASNPACFFTVLLAFGAYTSYTFAIAAFDVHAIGVWWEAKKNPVMGVVWTNGCEARSSPLSLISRSFAIFVVRPTSIWYQSEDRFKIFFESASSRFLRHCLQSLLTLLHFQLQSFIIDIVSPHLASLCS